MQCHTRSHCSNHTKSHNLIVQLIQYLSVLGHCMNHGPVHPAAPFIINMLLCQTLSKLLEQFKSVVEIAVCAILVCQANNWVCRVVLRYDMKLFCITIFKFD